MVWSNYALTSGEPLKVVAEAVVQALRHHEELSELTEAEVTVVPAGDAEGALQELADECQHRYGDAFNSRTYGVFVDDRQ